MKLANNTVQIELHVPDFEKAKDFYGKLGFEVVWERKPEDKKGYLVIKRDNNILCFWPGTEQVAEQSYFKNFPADTKRGFGVEIVIMVEDIETLYKTAETFCKIVDPLQKQPWDLKDFRIEDPFGFYIRFTEPHDILDSSNAVD